ncbi:(Fe-S)-binding protein [Herbidospora cretacea]|uniref:(Fe-S)-binding protein n=1 Tax=Herbidospora cretacea TaxID=28444 RepID=UPI0004C3BA65|nr:(Fe-S)-binding protein [Herbidospora cretacea]
MRVALFITCVNDTLFPGTGKATVGLLRRLGVEVDFPLAQTCCGQMHLNTGYRDEAVRLAGRFTTTFASYDAVVAPSGSCAAMVREQYPHLDVENIPKVYDLSEFLVDVLGVTDVGAYFPHKVTYHPTCHSLRGLKVGDKPARLLENVRGLELVPLPGAEECCGFGGTFAVKNRDVSAAMCADKIGNVMKTGAEVLCAADNSCLLHIGGTLKRQKSGVRVLHLAEILASTEENAG